MAHQPFASSPPIFNSFPDLDTAGSSKQQRADASDDVRKRSGDKSRRASHKERRDRKKSHEDPAKEEGHRTRSRHAAGFESNMWFRDTKGDSLNVTYGYLHAKDVPKYNATAGLQSNLGVLYKGSRGIEIGERTWFSKAPQLSSSRARVHLANERVVRLERTERVLHSYPEVDGVISLPAEKGKDRALSYRPTAEKDDSDSQSSEPDVVCSEDDSGLRTLSAREEAIQELERKLSKDPASTRNWLLLLNRNLADIPLSSKNAEKARAEVAQSVLERAIAAHQSNKGSFTLRYKYLRFGEFIWEKKRLEDEWSRCLEDAFSHDMLVEWLDWRIRTASHFDEALAFSAKALERAEVSADDGSDILKLRLIWRIVIFLQQSGFVERGFAIFQALAELNFYTPPNQCEARKSDLLDSLEEFWDSEVPRIGEDNAEGWAKWVLKLNRKFQLSKSDRPSVQFSTSSPYDVWREKEIQMDESAFIPMRMQAEEDSLRNDDDPYASVLFSDIRAFLFRLQTREGRHFFRLIWLSCLGLHIPGLSNALSPIEKPATDDRWASAPLMRSDFLDGLFPSPNERVLVTSDSLAGAIIGREKAYANTSQMFKSWTLGSSDILNCLASDGRVAFWNKENFVHFSSERLKAVRNVFEQLQQDESDTQWSILRLAFEACNPNCQSVQKISQAVLASNSSSAELLAAHAQLECQSRKFEKARKVYRIGIESIPQSESRRVHLLWGLAEMEWLVSGEEAALSAIYAAVGQERAERSGIYLLKAKRGLNDLTRKEVSPDWIIRLQWIKLRILLEILTTGLDAAVEFSGTLLSNIEPGTPWHESLTMESLLIFYRHTVVLRNYSRPALLREAVAKALDIYPDNSVIFGLFLECEKGEGVWGRVKAVVGGGLNDINGRSIARRLMDAWTGKWETGRWSSEVERLRSGFEAAVSSDRTKGSAVIWKAYIVLELAAEQPQKAKAVLFRAIGECPLVKDFYLLAFDSRLRSSYNTHELMSLAETMAERGIRIRQTLEEVLEEHGVHTHTEGISAVEVDDEENELEHESRELRRLMPY